MRGRAFVANCIGIALAVGVGSPGRAQSSAYALPDLVTLLKTQTSAQVLARAREHCIAFVPSAPSDRELRAAGADESLLTGLRSACVRGAAAPAQPRTTTLTAASGAPRPQSTGRARETLSNASIVALSSARVGDDVILEAIRTTPSSFDLSVRGLLSLRRGGVSPAVIAAMQQAQRPDGASTPSPESVRASLVSPVSNRGGTSGPTRADVVDLARGWNPQYLQRMIALADSGWPAYSRYALPPAPDTIKDIPGFPDSIQLTAFSYLRYRVGIPGLACKSLVATIREAPTGVRCKTKLVPADSTGRAATQRAYDWLQSRLDSLDAGLWRGQDTTWGSEQRAVRMYRNHDHETRIKLMKYELADGSAGSTYLSLDFDWDPRLQRANVAGIRSEAGQVGTAVRALGSAALSGAAALEALRIAGNEPFTSFDSIAIHVPGFRCEMQRTAAASSGSDRSGEGPHSITCYAASGVSLIEGQAAYDAAREVIDPALAQDGWTAFDAPPKPMALRSRFYSQHIESRNGADSGFLALSLMRERTSFTVQLMVYPASRR